MKRIKNLFMRHKVLGVISIFTLIMFLIIIYMVLWMTLSNSNSYGDRLDGIEEVDIDQTFLKGCNDKVKEHEEVSKVSSRVQGRIIYFDITYKTGTPKEKAIEIAEQTQENFDEDEKNFYDFEYVLQEETNKEDSEYKPFVIFGTRKYASEKITWANS